MKDGIVLVHGILSNRYLMQGLAVFLRKHNYHVLNINYPSSKHEILALSDLLHTQINQFNEQMPKLHFIGHSMGGLIIRAYITKYNPINLGRVIMLGTPNKGSEIADFLQNNWIYKKLYGPAGQQLITDQTKFELIFGSINYELGIISGVSQFHQLANRIIGEASDGRVSINSTKIVGMKEHRIINSMHAMIPNKRKVWYMVLNFINTGTFD